MRAKLWLVLLLCALFCLLTLTTVPPGSVAAVGQLRLLFATRTQVAVGPLQLDVSVTPPVTRPGTSLSLSLTVTNRSSDTAVPEIIVALPDGISLDRRALPPATSLNLQTNSLSWQPVVGPDGVRELLLNLQADVADFSHPERTITATLRQGSSSETTSTTVWVGLAPQASISMSPVRASIGQPVQLVANLNGPGPFSQLWHLGDGRVVDADDPVIVYALPGTYHVTLQAANPLAAATVTRLITIVPEPAAHFRSNQGQAGVNQPITFINQSGGQPPLRYEWDFGDGNTSSEPQPSHLYQEAGTYVVRLTVANDLGQAEALWPVTIGLPPLADMLLDEVGRAGEPVQGEGFGDHSVTEFRWDMGDGHILEGPRISHVYRKGGYYWVTLTAGNSYAQTQISRWVHIESGTSYLFLPLVAGGETGDTHLLDFLAADPEGTFGSLDEEFEAVSLQPLNLPRSATPAEQLYYYINSARQMFELPPLNHVYELTVASQRHAEDMATNHFTGHTGSDGTTPPMRQFLYGYAYGYGGEVTAWGLEKAIKAVEFWLNSPPHRRILLNQAISDVGVGYAVDYNSPNVWYWTAEFGSPALPVIEVTLPAPPTPAQLPPLRLLEPAPDTSITAGLNYVILSWEWSDTLASDQHFVVYWSDGEQERVLGKVTQPLLGAQYQLRLLGSMLAPAPTTASGRYNWLVRLENNEDGRTLTESEPRPIQIIVPR
jgi:PKD repeat protein